MGYKEKASYDNSGEAVAQVARRGGGAPSLQTAKVRLDGAVSTDGAVGIPVHCRGLDWMAFKDPFQLRWFCDNEMAAHHRDATSIPCTHPALQP